MDQITRNAIAKLHPSVRKEVEDMVNEANAILASGRAQMRITQGLRTDAEQNALYAKGRTAPGPKVTNAKAGQSIHNYGFAIDYVLIIDGKTASWDISKDYNMDGKADWKQIADVFKKHGWNWGGDWTSFKDYPHLEKSSVGDWRSLANKKRDKEGYVIL